MVCFVTADPGTLALAYAPGGILSLIVAPIIGNKLDGYRARFILPVISAVGAGATALLLISTTLWQVALVLIVDLTVLVTASLILAKFLSVLSDEKRGSVFGWATGFEKFCALIGPIIGGVIWDLGGIKAPFYVSIGVEAFLVPTYYILFAFVAPIDEMAIQIEIESKKQENEPLSDDHVHSDI